MDEKSLQERARKTKDQIDKELQAALLRLKKEKK